MQSQLINKNPIFDEDFKIKEVRFRAMKPYELPVAFTDATMGPFDKYSIASIRVVDEDGNYGEVPTFASNQHFFEYFLMPKLFGDKREAYEKLFHRLYWSIRNEGFRGAVSTALGQLDYALYDLAARRKGISLSAYVGAKRNWVKVYGCGGSLSYSQQELMDEANSFIDRGFDLLKIKVGLNWGKTIEQDVERLEQFHHALNGQLQLALDANQVWTAEEANCFIHKVKHLNIAWFEEPCHSADLIEIEALCKDCPVPVSYGESEKTSRVFPSLLRAGVTHFQPLPGYLSSMDEYFQVMKLAADNNIQFSSGGYSHMNCQMLAAGTESMLSEFIDPFNSSLERYLKTFPKIVDGKLVIEESVGSAFTINWDLIAEERRIQIDKTWTKADFDGIGAKVN